MKIVIKTEDLIQYKKLVLILNTRLNRT